MRLVEVVFENASTYSTGPCYGSIVYNSPAYLIGSRVFIWSETNSNHVVMRKNLALCGEVTYESSTWMMCSANGMLDDFDPSGIYPTDTDDTPAATPSETVTYLSYDPHTKNLTYTSEDATVTTIDMSSYDTLAYSDVSTTSNRIIETSGYDFEIRSGGQRFTFTNEGMKWNGQLLDLTKLLPEPEEPPKVSRVKRAIKFLLG